ncbi:MAG: kdsB1 [Clostridiaceae bacterium]|nr:kdsB1 [Clostridiaceae bacterium]
MKVCTIIQARTGSTRLPKKVLRPICGIPILIHDINRIKKSKLIDKIIIATTDNKNDDAIVNLLKKVDVGIFRGNEEDVLDRYYKAAKEYNADIIVRITSDNPLMDYRVVDGIIENLINEKTDYSCNNMPRTFPYGMDCECFTFKVLQEAWENAKEPYEREHVTPYIRNNKFYKKSNLLNSRDLSNLRFTVDTIDDFKYVEKIYENLYFNYNDFTTEDILNYLNI